MIVEDATLLESSEESQAVESKCKEVTSRDKKGHWPPKKAKGKQQGKYCGSTVVKMDGTNFYERYMSTGQDCLVHYSR